jgi:glycosyltransferase involved in cell wall biosynthesis
LGRRVFVRRVAAFVPNILGISPGQRHRIEAWSPGLERAGWAVDFYPFEDERLHSVIYSPGHWLEKSVGLLRCYARQARQVLNRPPCDVVLVFREAALVGPAVLERLLRRWGAPILYDIDDPVFVPYTSPTSGYWSLLKCARKTHALFKMSHTVVAINRLIGDYAARFNEAVTIVPNFVDTDHYRPRGHDAARAGRPARLVWMGSRSTIGNLASLGEPLRRLQNEGHAPPRVVSVGEPRLPGVALEVRSWTPTTEVSELQDCDIGLVPVPDSPWNRWKFFLKTIQFMAVGLPVVAQRMGSNPEVVEDGVSGFVVETSEQWYRCLKMLLLDENLRLRMGKAAREVVERHYSRATQLPRVIELFERMPKKKRVGVPGLT